MTGSRSSNEAFLNQLQQIIEENISNEQFGVSELADKIGMSRSNLLRKVTKASGLSVSQYIRKIRLNRATELLKEEDFNVSEVAYKVGFSSPSYFIKCYREEYGYSPGSIPEQQPEDELEEQEDTVKQKSSKRNFPIWIVAIVVPLLTAIIFFAIVQPTQKSKVGPKSIAVLPFINDSNDSSNVYIINGIMESTLNKLQGINDLRVISRTSVEKYRRMEKTVPEIAVELGVDYVVEGSGQKINDQIQLHVQLIEASTDNHLWAQRYTREVKDIFELQNDVARNIVNEIQVFITPEEREQIDKKPTQSLLAYDLFLKGREYLSRMPASQEDLRTSISFFRKAVAIDENFARAYAALSMSYYFIEEYREEKIYIDSINFFADKALYCDASLPQGMIAKALFYMANKNYELAEPYFQKALELKPNYDLVFYFLVDLYADPNHLSNTKKYLEFALRRLQVDPIARDSVANSFNYLHVSNAFAGAGFIDEALFYIDRSLEYWPGNLYAETVKAYVEYASNGDLDTFREKLKIASTKEAYRLDIFQDVAKVCYFQRDYETAYQYYQHYLEIKNAAKLDIYPEEDVKIAFTCQQLDKSNEAQSYLEAYYKFAESDNSIYKDIYMCYYYAATGEIEMAIKALDNFSKQEEFHYWTVLYLDIDPLLDDLRDQKEYQRISKKIKSQFNAFHTQMKTSLEEKGLI